MQMPKYSILLTSACDTDKRNATATESIDSPFAAPVAQLEVKQFNVCGHCPHTLNCLTSSPKAKPINGLRFGANRPCGSFHDDCRRKYGSAPKWIFVAAGQLERDSGQFARRECHTYRPLVTLLPDVIFIGTDTPMKSVDDCGDPPVSPCFRCGSGRAECPAHSRSAATRVITATR